MGGVTSDTEEYGENVADFVTKLKDKMLRVHELCREHLQQSLERERRDYDTRISINNYNVGDLVYALNSTKTVGKSYKLKSARWKGPLVIVRKISDLLFEVRGPPKTKPKVLHHDRLKPYLSEDRPPWIQTLRDKLHKVPTTKETVEPTTVTAHDADAAETKTVPSPQDTPEPDVKGKETIPLSAGSRIDTHTAKVKVKDSCEAIPVSKLATWQEQCKAPEISTNVSDATVNKALNKRVSLWKGDITCLKVDCIVNSAKPSLLGGSGVDGAIHKKAGPALKKECSTLGGCDTGQAKITQGYQLPAAFVIHTVGPVGTNPGLLKDCYINCLDLAKEQGLHSIAFPCISTGIYGYPSARATPVAVETVRKWLENNKSCHIRVIFCCFQDKDMDIYKENMAKYFPVFQQPVQRQSTRARAAPDRFQAG